MIKFILMQNKNKKSSVCGKWFAYPVADETVDLAALAHHMEEHNTGFSEAMCLGMMTGMVKCIKEMLLQGKNVKIDNLAIFSVGIKNKEGADSEEAFNAATNIAGVKLRARATGTLNSANLNSAASVRKANTKKASTSTGAVEKPSTGGSDSGITPTTPSGGGSSNPGGSSSTGGGSSSTGSEEGGNVKEY